MYRTLILIVTILLPVHLEAQIVHWHGYLNEAYFNIVLSSPTDSAGNRYYAGHFNGFVDLDPNPQELLPIDPLSWENPFIGKLHSDYSLDWVRTFPSEAGSVYDVLPTADGGLLFIITAEFWVDLDPGPDSLIIENPFSSQISILCKWTSDGKPEWFWHAFPGAFNTMKLNTHPEGGYLLHGWMNLEGIINSNDTIFLSNAKSSYITLHFDQDGNLLNFNRVGATSGGSIFPIESSFSDTTEGHYYVAGSISGDPSMIIDGVLWTCPPAVPSNKWRSFVAKVSNGGELQNLRLIEGTSNIRVLNLHTDGQGGNYVTGLFLDTLLLPQISDTIRLVSVDTQWQHADLFVGRLDGDNNWLWARQLSGEFDFYLLQDNWEVHNTTNNGLLLVASTYKDVYLDPLGVNKRILVQSKGVTTFSMKFDQDGNAGCAFPLMQVDTTYPELNIMGLDRRDTFRYYWHGIYTDTLTLFDGTTFPAGSRASYMIDASFCPEYPCADIEAAPCSDTLRACTWSASSWQWYKDGVHLPQADGDSLLVISDNGLYMLIATLEDDCPYQRPDTALVEISHFIPYFVEIQPVNCQWGQHGKAFVHVTGGIGPFLYRLDSLPYQANPLFEDLKAGMHAIHINSQKHGCEFMDSLYIDSLTATHLQTYRCHGDTLLVGHHNFHSGEVDTLLLLESLVHPGCDSAVFLMAHFTPPALLSTTMEYVCDSTEVGVDTVAILFSSSPCDSLVAIHQYLWAPTWHLDSLIWLCEGDSIFLNNFWHREEASLELSYSSSQGCDSILFLEIRMVRPPVFDTYLDTLVPVGMTITLHAPQATGYLYTWEPIDGLSCSDCPNPSLLAEEDRTFTLYFSDEQGCFNHIAIYSVRVFAHEIALPNLFTPNGDGVNDKFGPLVLNGPASSVQILNFTIFNRWGQAIYNSNDPISAWDGSCAGAPCPMDTYAWVLEVSFANGQHQVLRGEINLIR